DDLINARNRENARISRERARLEEQNKARIAVERLKAGSRFNLRYEKTVPEGTRPQDVMAALAEYIDFSPAARAGNAAPPALAPGPSGLPRKGMSLADAEREFGRPAEVSDRREGA